MRFILFLVIREIVIFQTWKCITGQATFPCPSHLPLEQHTGESCLFLLCWFPGWSVFAFLVKPLTRWAFELLKSNHHEPRYIVSIKCTPDFRFHAKMYTLDTSYISSTLLR